jgi:hypothetical protein
MAGFYNPRQIHPRLQSHAWALYHFIATKIECDFARCTEKKFKNKTIKAITNLMNRYQYLIFKTSHLVA